MEKIFFENINCFKVNKANPSIPIFENRKRNKPRVTIAIPTYKRVSTLSFAVESALSQDYDDYEIIVIDNNPERNDETELFMIQYKEKSGISYYKNKINIGLFGNWNRCFEMSHGEWVTLLHDDDYYFSNYLSTMMYYLDKYPNIQGLYCHHIRWYQDKETNNIDVVNDSRTRQRGVVKISGFPLFFAHDIGPVGIFYKKEYVLTLGGYNSNNYPISDYELNWRYSMKYNLYFLNTTLVHYRIGINVSIKPETLELQEEKNLLIRMQYASKKKCKPIMFKIAKLNYNNSMASIQKANPKYNWKKFYYKNYIWLFVWFVIQFYQHKIKENIISLFTR